MKGKGGTKAGDKATRLGDMLSLWEDTQYLAQLMAELAKRSKLPVEVKNGAKPRGLDDKRFEEWPNLRKQLLHALDPVGPDAWFDVSPYKGDMNPSYFIPENGDAFTDQMLTNDYPKLVTAWVANSRRLFSLSPDLQALFNATSLDGITFRDLHFPFPSFAIELDAPIVGNGGNNYDLLIYSSNHELSRKGSILSTCWLVDRRLQDYRPISLPQKNQLQQSMNRRNWFTAQQKLLQLERHMARYRHSITYIVWGSDEKDRLITDYAETFIQGVTDHFRHDYPEKFQEVEEHIAFDWPAQHQAMRVLAGVCLYLRSLPNNSSFKSEWQGVATTAKSASARSITRESEVCMLSTSFALTPEERKTFRSQNVVDPPSHGSTISPHFRRGHWRRPQGQGQNPEAEKTLWIKPTIVNRGMLKEGELPLGAETILRDAR